MFFVFKQKTAYERRISDWSSDVCSSVLPSLSKRIRETYVIHRSRRDQLVRWLRDADEVPVASEVAYELLNEASTPAEVSAIAIEVEHACTETYADLVGRAVGAQRRWAITAMIDAAPRAVRFGGPEDGRAAVWAKGCKS